ncbi:MAG TPA: HlyD family efflux transporter periplasmic adaptor subunit [Gemmatimonadaceae bacterium]|nr:HlyD family efflux transporter periplasmic adaptor subunit [Gemmatimonadaceae bacterium]
MDIARPRQKNNRRYLYIGAGVLAIVVITVALSRLQPAAPTVDGGTLYQDTVRRGDMVIEVRGPGNLVPEHIRQITAGATGRIDRLVVQAGAKVGPDDVLIEMSNPDVEIASLQAQQQYSQARAQLVELKSTLQGNMLSQQNAIAAANTQYVQATQDAAAADSLAVRRLISTFELNTKRAAAREAATRLRVEQERLKLMEAQVDSQVAVQQAQVSLLRTIAESQQHKLQSLNVRAGDVGVVQDMNLEQGQWVTEGTTIAKVVEPGKLKAVLRIPETQAKDVQVGQGASIDTRNGIVAGHVSRKDPSAQQGTVTIDVALDGPLPQGAVPDLSVDGTIQIQKLANVLYTGRPAYGAGTGLVGLFKIVEGGKYAVRTQVQLGRSSVNTVEIVRGLNVGDRVILSDMSQWDAVDRVRIK